MSKDPASMVNCVIPTWSLCCSAALVVVVPELKLAVVTIQTEITSVGNNPSREHDIADPVLLYTILDAEVAKAIDQ